MILRFLIMLLLLFPVAILQAKPYDKIIAIVDDSIITEYDMRFARLREPGKISDELLLSKLVDQRIQEGYAIKNNISVTDHDISLALDDILSQNNMTLENFVKALQRDDLSLDLYKEKLKNELLLLKLHSIELLSKVVVSDPELAEYYKNHLDDFKSNEKRTISHILFAIFPDDPRFSSKIALENAKKVLKLLASGSKFEDLAKKYSDDPTGASGGKLGSFKQGILNANLDSAAFRLNEGEYSKLIITDNGIHILYVDKISPSSYKEFKSVKDEIVKIVESEKSAKLYNKWISKIRKNTYIEYKQH